MEYQDWMGALPDGIRIRRDSFVLDFYYRGVRCRPTLKNVPVTKRNLKVAENKRAAVLYEIAMGTFDYASHFPNCPKARLFSAPAKTRKKVGVALDEWLEIKSSKTARSTLKGYRTNISKHLRPYFGDMYLDEVTKTVIERFQATELKDLANKTINEIMIPLRGAMKNARADRVIDYNPLDDVDNLTVHVDEPDPFTREEIDRILTTKTWRVQEVNMMQFAFWTGVRLSELIALAWEDVDLVNRTVMVRRARVAATYKVPKTRGSVRTLELNSQAWDAIEKQREHTEMLTPVGIAVIQRDNRTVREEQLRFLFTRTRSITQHPSDGTVRDRFWKTHLRLAKVRYRGPNHARHTFASQMLTAGLPKDWIAGQMGHTSTRTLEKRYAKWIPEEAPDMPNLVDRLFGFSAKNTETDKASSNKS